MLEDDFPLGRPALEEVGVTFVDDVSPYELMKLRILNGGHAEWRNGSFDAAEALGGTRVRCEGARYAYHQRVESHNAPAAPHQRQPRGHPPASTSCGTCACPGGVPCGPP